MPEFAPEADHPLSKEVDKCIEELLALPEVPGAVCHEMRQKLASRTFNLVVAGQFKRGKTTVINALIGTDLLPVGVVPLTSAVTILNHGTALAIEAVFNDNTRRTVPPEALWEYITEKGNPANFKGIREVLISYPSPWLKQGVRVIDTPGIGSVYQHNTDVAYRFLPKADAVILVLSVDQPVSQAEYDFLKQIGEFADKIIFLLNKSDLLSADELHESLEFSKTALGKATHGAVSLFPVSARLALEGRLKKSDEKLHASLFPAFLERLRAFLMSEKEQALLASIIRNLLRLISQVRFGQELEMKSLTTPLAELRKKIDLFEEKKRELLASQADYDILIDGETKKLVKEVVEADLAAYKAELSRRVTMSVARYFSEHRALPSRQLHEALDEHATAEIRNGFDKWRAAEDEKLSKAFNAICARFSLKINDTVDELYRFASDLFGIAFDSVQAGAVWATSQDFYYKFWHEPPSLHILASSFVHALPKAIGDSLILKRAQVSARESVDTQSGRIRYEFAQRLEQSARQFKKDMVHRISAAIEGIESAITKGTTLAQAGESKLAERSEILLATKRKLEAIEAHLHKTLASTGTKT